jgi:hypothetical protein
MSRTSPVRATARNAKKAGFLLALLAVTACRLWLIIGVPKMSLFAAGHDDAFFAKAAHYLLQGQWFGPYSEMTLIKSPFYAFFLTASHFTRLPLMLTETIFYVLACLLFLLALSPLPGSPWWKLAGFAFVLFNPAALLTSTNIRVYREFVYLSLLLYVAAFATGLLVRSTARPVRMVWWALGLGVSVGAFLLCREEGVWIFPAVLLILAAALKKVWEKPLDLQIGRTALLLLPVLLWNVPSWYVARLNYLNYGWGIVQEESARDPQRLLSTLSRIRTSAPWHPAVQIPAQARVAAYGASAQMDSLRPWIEGGMPEWNQWEDQLLTRKPAWYVAEYGGDGGDLDNTYFMWLLRSAVADAGHARTGESARVFYEQLANQLEARCASGDLECGPALPVPLVGSFQKEHGSIALRMLRDDIPAFLELEYITVPDLNIRQWPAWRSREPNQPYFQEFTFDPVDTVNASGVLTNETRVQMRELARRPHLFRIIRAVYRRMTLPALGVSVAGTLLLFMGFRGRLRHSEGTDYLWIMLFLLIMLFSRIILLVAVDAMTFAAGMDYITSAYPLLYALLAVTGLWLLTTLPRAIHPRVS